MADESMALLESVRKTSKSAAGSALSQKPEKKG
jgi:hypothetical protein